MNIEQMVGKEVTYKGKPFVIVGHEIINGLGFSSIYFRIKPTNNPKSTDSSLVTILQFTNKVVTTEDEELLAFIEEQTPKFNSDKHNHETLEQLRQVKNKKLEAQKREEEEKRVELQKIEDSETGSIRGKSDARNRNSQLYTILNKGGTKAENYSYEFISSYLLAYKKEKEAMKFERLLKNRSKDDMKTYPGDLDVLLEWMRNNILRIDVFAPNDKINHEQQFVDALNSRDGTNYQIKNRPGLYIAYEAYFKNPTSAPKEFLEWLVSKNNFATADLNDRVMDHPMDIKTGKMSCNALVKDMLYNDEYRFHVGRYTK